MATADIFTLSDLLENVEAQLQNSPYPQLRNLGVTIRDDRLILTGEVQSYYLKQVAQEQVRSLAIENDFRVVNNLIVTDNWL